MVKNRPALCLVRGNDGGVTFTGLRDPVRFWTGRIGDDGDSARNTGEINLLLQPPLFRSIECPHRKEQPFTTPAAAG